MASHRKLHAFALGITAALVAANMWVVGLLATPDGEVVGSPGGFLSSWTWINAIYAALCGYWIARLSAEEATPAVRRLKGGFAFVLAGCVGNLALVDLAGLDLFWIWHFVDAALVLTFLAQAKREWSAA